MRPDEEDVFGEYAAETKTTAPASVKPSDAGEDESEIIKQYGLNKPRRKIVRATIAADEHHKKQDQ